MTELFTPKLIRCEHCGFEFVVTGFNSGAKIVCLACGQETTLPKPAAPPNSSERQSELPAFLSHPAAEPLLCSVEHCPLLNGGESDSAVAGQIKLRLRKKGQRRRTILAWTVTLQVCVLLGVSVFIAKSLLISDKNPPVQPIVHVTHVKPESDTETKTPEHVKPLPAMPVANTAQGNIPGNAFATTAELAQNNTPNHEPFAVIAEPKDAAFPHDFSSAATAHEIFPPPVFDTVTDSGDTVPGSPIVAGSPFPEHLPAPLTQGEPMTLEMAHMLLESAKTTLAVDPENSVRQAARAAKIYEQLGHAFPDSLYWIIGNAFASLSWGEPLLESSPVIETMTLSADNRYLLAQLRDKTVWLWDLQNPESERLGYLLDQGTAEYVKFVFSADLRWIIGGQKNGLIRIWDMSLKRPADTLITFVERVPDLQDLQISPNGQWLVAFGRLPQDISPIRTLQSEQPIQQVNYQPDRMSVIDSSAHPIVLWNLRQMETGVIPMATPVPSMPQQAQIARFSPHSDRLAVVGKDAIVRVYDLKAKEVNEEPLVLRGHQLGITQIAFAPCGQWLATGSRDNTVRLWNLTSSKASPESTTLFGHIGWISALTIDPSGEYIFSGSYDRTIRIWSMQYSQMAALTAQPIVLKTNLGVPESLAVTQDGDKMIVLGSEGSLGIYHLPSLFEDDPEDYFRAVTFRNSGLSISKSLLTTDDQLLIFSYEHLLNPSNSGIRLWALQMQPFVQ